LRGLALFFAMIFFITIFFSDVRIAPGLLSSPLFLLSFSVVMITSYSLTPNFVISRPKLCKVIIAVQIVTILVFFIVTFESFKMLWGPEIVTIRGGIIIPTSIANALLIIIFSVLNLGAICGPISIFYEKKPNPNKRIEIDGENATHSPASHS